jgi:hypothetical protein
MQTAMPVHRACSDPRMVATEAIILAGRIVSRGVQASFMLDSSIAFS